MFSMPNVALDVVLVELEVVWAGVVVELVVVVRVEVTVTVVALVELEVVWAGVVVELVIVGVGVEVTVTVVVLVELDVVLV